MDHTVFANLTYGQRTAIERIIQAQSDGIPLTRVLKTSYSCRWCGEIVGRPGEKREHRKLGLLQHEQNCKRYGDVWIFATNVSTFYSKWMKLPHFTEALETARSMATAGVMQAAAQRLQTATLSAANELARQITEADSDGNRRLASVAILDRADVSTASKQAAGDTTVKIIKGVSIDDL